MKEMKMYEAPKMEIVEVEMRDGMMVNTSSQTGTGSVEDGDDEV